MENTIKETVVINGEEKEVYGCVSRTENKISLRLTPNQKEANHRGHVLTDELLTHYYAHRKSLIEGLKEHKNKVDTGNYYVGISYFVRGCEECV